MTKTFADPSTDPAARDLGLLDTSHVSDALDKLGINGQIGGLLPLQRTSRMVVSGLNCERAPGT